MLAVSRSRSRTLLVTALATLVATGMLAGCAKKKVKPELRLPRTATSAANDSWSADSLAAGKSDPSFGANQWGPGGAPGAGEFDQGFSMDANGRSSGAAADGAVSGSLPAGASVDETGSYANSAAANGVDGAVLSAELEMVHFPFDSFEIAPEFITLLDAHSQWLQTNSTVMVQVEGHTDERGTEEYNIALGQRRADAVRTYLIERGIDPNRISTNSYGKMRPLVYEDTEESHALNRRAMFLVYQVDESVAAAY